MGKLKRTLREAERLVWWSRKASHLILFINFYFIFNFIIIFGNAGKWKVIWKLHQCPSHLLGIARWCMHFWHLTPNFFTNYKLTPHLSKITIDHILFKIINWPQIFFKNDVEPKLSIYIKMQFIHPWYIYFLWFLFEFCSFFFFFQSFYYYYLLFIFIENIRLNW